mmetsp:Transcript_123405/g.360338  ORF Transcript_123405/g.360338 Transcript_123405/m.360338 type:complete len:208 (+) Transcript_123405:175-798(+)
MCSFIVSTKGARLAHLSEHKVQGVHQWPSRSRVYQPNSAESSSVTLSTMPALRVSQPHSGASNRKRISPLELHAHSRPTNSVPACRTSTTEVSFPAPLRTRAPLRPTTRKRPGSAPTLPATSSSSGDAPPLGVCQGVQALLASCSATSLRPAERRLEASENPEVRRSEVPLRPSERRLDSRLSHSPGVEGAVEARLEPSKSPVGGRA